MKNIANKSKNNTSLKNAITVALILMLTSLTFLSTVTAQTSDDPEIQYYIQWTYVSTAPSPVGVGQAVSIVTWTQHTPPVTPDDHLLGSGGNRPAWTGITVTLTKPDGTKENIAMPVTDSIGSTYAVYYPDAIGTYSVQAHNPGQWKNTTDWHRYYELSDSDIVTFTVTEDQLEYMPGVSLPTEYWSRPINARLREWSQVAGNWLKDGTLHPYTPGPETAHIVWTEPIFFGGIVGGEHEQISYYTGSSYQTKWSGAVIINGVLMYDQPLSDSTTSSHRKVMARDLRTGELLWELNGTSSSMGTLYDYESPNQHGVHPYLWVSGNRVLDPFTGTELFSYTNVPRGTAAVGPNGERYIYEFDLTAGWLALWDFSAPLTTTNLSPSALEQYLIDGVEVTNYWQWRPVGKVHDGNDGYRWNVTIPTDLGPSYSRDFERVVYDANGVPEMIIASSGCTDRWITIDPMTMYALSLKSGEEGTLLWKTTFKMPFENATVDPGYGMIVDPENRVFILPITQTRQWYGFDLDSGQQIWGPTDSQPQFDYFRMYPTQTAEDGRFFAGGYGGIIHAYDTTTGNLLWTANTGTVGLEAVYAYWPMYSEPNIIDGKVYVKTDEHSQTQPLYRGWSMFCFDAESGDQLWNITGIWKSFSFADGYLVSLNEFDNQIYAFGKGSSATTVSTSQNIISHGGSVLIEGSVIDTSSGTERDDLVKRFPNGVPAISDEDMTEWMEYLYMQLPKPKDAEGVEVVITTLDPNGNTYELGRTTTDISGTFGIAVDPPVSGLYKIIATFGGSDSYYGSSAVTYINVEEAPSAAQSMEPELTAPEAATTEAPLITTEIAIIAAVAVACIIGVVAFWALRKRK